MITTSKHCLVTVTTESYSLWTMTMIFSFLQSNEGFDGDIIIIGNDLTDETKKKFAVFQNIIFRKPTKKLIEKVNHLATLKPGFKNIGSMFFSLELFNMQGYKKVLFLDSDMLIIKPVSEVFEFEDLLVASAESCWYSGKGRRTDTYEALPNFPDKAMFIKNPVNSGFMVVDKALVTDDIYQGLINMIEPTLWENKNTFHADQLIINLFFKGRITLADARYNYRPTNAAVILEKDSVGFDEAKIIHFYRQYKPWNFKEVFELSQHDMVNLKAFKLWYTYFIDFLKFYHLKSKINNLIKNE